jgi:hypothetical protein
MPRKKTSSGVSSKNTKQEILDAYNELLLKVEEGGTASLPSPKKLEKVTNDVDKKLKVMVEEISDVLNANINDVLVTVRDLFDSLKVLEEVKVQEMVTRKREQEEYSYRIQRERQMENDKWDTEKDRREQDIAIREALLKESEDELNTLRTRVATFDQRLEEIVSEQVEEKVATISGEYEHKMALQTLAAESERKLLTEKVASLENMISSQREEITRLNNHVDITSQRLADVAGGAVSHYKTPISHATATTED